MWLHENTSKTTKHVNQRTWPTFVIQIKSQENNITKCFYSTIKNILLSILSPVCMTDTEQTRAHHVRVLVLKRASEREITGDSWQDKSSTTTWAISPLAQPCWRWRKAKVELFAAAPSPQSRFYRSLWDAAICIHLSPFSLCFPVLR